MIAITYSIRTLPFISSPQSTVHSPVFLADSLKRPGYQQTMAVEVMEAVEKTFAVFFNIWPNGGKL